MRAIFILLFVANAVFFGRHFFLSESPEFVQIVAVDVQREGGAVLELLVEQNKKGAGHDRVSAGSKRGAVVSDVQAGAELCMMIGPYGELLQAEYALERLVALGGRAHMVPVDIKGGEFYLVYLRPEISEKEAVRRLYELQKKGIDSHVITKGDFANGISFGRFGDFAQAGERVKEMKDSGYAAEIKMLPKVIRETWVALDAGFAEKIDENVWLELLAGEKGLERRLNYCLGVASD